MAVQKEPLVPVLVPALVLALAPALMAEVTDTQRRTQDTLRVEQWAEVSDNLEHMGSSLRWGCDA